jgi:hypothetical protein
MHFSDKIDAHSRTAYIRNDITMCENSPGIKSKCLCNRTEWQKFLLVEMTSVLETGSDKFRTNAILQMIKPSRRQTNQENGTNS